MNSPRQQRVEIDEHGRLVLPPELLAYFGLKRGEKITIEVGNDVLRIRRSPHKLARVYLEPTNICNLDCRTCMRNVWNEPLGRMLESTFTRVLEGLNYFTPAPSVFFGGFGEPFSHPDLLEMIGEVTHLGIPVEIITNGILLTEEKARQLITLGVERLWVSIDGASPESYEDVRLGAALPLVLSNLENLHRLNYASGSQKLRLGIAFVAMKRNIQDLSALIRLGKSLGADRFSVSNVLPHTAELNEQRLYGQLLSLGALGDPRWQSNVDLPMLELSPNTLKSLMETVRGGCNLSINGEPLGTRGPICPFVAKGSISIRWDGAVSPCLPLLHTHVSYLDDRKRQSVAYTIGNILERNLADLWNDPVYEKLRERIQDFDFSPCTSCNSCEMVDANLEDCFGNTQPACGGCLWAQGFIQCP